MSNKKRTRFRPKKQRPNQQAQRKKTIQPTNQKGMTHHTVKEATTLLPFLLSLMPNRSRNSVKSILARGQVTVDGEVLTQYNHPLKPEQVVGILSNQAALQQSSFEGFEILHEDKDILVINKEAGLLSVAANDPTELTAYRQLSEYVKKEHPDNRIFVVHRLDRDTSGVMLYAKSEAVKNALQNNWNDTVKERMYTALVEGVVSKDQGTLSSWLSESKSMKVYSSPTDSGGKHAITHYRKVLNNANYSLLEVELETGRKNQIRVHLQDMGHPIVGDKKYGAEGNPMKRLGLHATTLVLVHPGTNKLVRYTAEVPPVFLKFIK